MEMTRREFAKDSLTAFGFLTHPALSRFARGIRRKEVDDSRQACQLARHQGEGNRNDV